MPRAELDRGAAAADPCITPLLEPDEEVYGALVLGTRDYVEKNGFTDVVIGLSGGIDSSLVAAIAVDALGAERVHGVSMPSRYSSEHSESDAAEAGGEPRHRLPHHRHRAGPRRAARHAGPVVRGPRGRPHRGEPPVAHPGPAADGAVEQVRLARADHRQQERDGGGLLHALRRHGRRLRRHQGRAQDAGVRPVPRGATQRAGTRRSSREACSPSRRRPSCAPTSATTRACRPTRCSTRCSSRTSSSDRTAADLHRRGLRRRPRAAASPGWSTCAEYKRRQTPPGVRVTAKAFGKDRRLPITNGYRG